MPDSYISNVPVIGAFHSVVVSEVPKVLPDRLGLSALGWQPAMNGNNMKKNKGKIRSIESDEDTMWPEYDFSKALRGVTAARYAEASNVVILDPDVAEIFPDTRAVNEALRTIARLTHTALRKRARKRTA